MKDKIGNFLAGLGALVALLLIVLFCWAWHNESKQYDYKIKQKGIKSQPDTLQKENDDLFLELNFIKKVILPFKTSFFLTIFLI